MSRITTPFGRSAFSHLWERVAEGRVRAERSEETPPSPAFTSPLEKPNFRAFFQTPKVSPDSLVQSQPKSAAPLSTFLAVALLSAAVLGLEVALSRVFGVILRYQFAFLVVSLALCGLGLGALWAYLRPRTSLENAALGFGVAVAVALALILRGVFALVPQHYWLAALVTLLPFGFAGTFLSLAFGRFQAEGGRLYAFDLAGAALAAAGSVALMQFLSAVDACLFFGFLGALAGVLVSKQRAFPAVVCAILLAALPFNNAPKLLAALPFNATKLLAVLPFNTTNLQPWGVQPIPPGYQLSDAQWEQALKQGHEVNAESLADRGVTQPLFTEIGAQQETARRLAALQKAGKISKKLAIPRTRILDTRWNAFARTDVVSDPDAGPDSYLIYTNGNVPTNMIRWNGQDWQLPALVSQFPVSDWTFQNADLKDQSVFSIGPGGGLDALLALRYGAKSFEGAEINPSIVGLMNEPGYRAWNGGIYSNPKVHVRTAEGRDAVREAKGRYRLVFSALTKTATAGQGAALLESFIYTREAFNDYLKALDEDGAMAIVGDTPPLLARLTATAVDHFKGMGQTEREAGTHIAVVFDPQVRGPYEWVLLVKKTPFSPSQTLQMQQSARARQLLPLWIPGRAADDSGYPFGSLLSGALSLDAFVASGRQVSTAQPVALNLSPCSDDRPFVLDLGTSPLSLFQSSPSLTWMLGLSFVSTLALATFLSLGGREPVTAPPGVSALRRSSIAQNALGPLLFGSLGVGFMLIEVPLIQKMALPLGYPTLSLSVILFSILLGGGAGALFSQRFDGQKLRQHALICALGVVFLSLVFGFSSDVWSRALLSLPLVVRCLTVAAMLLPLGFLLGTPFPSGLRLFARDERGVALAWALNGTASVMGSIGAAVGAKMFGFSLVMALGAGVYVLVAGVFLARRAG